MNSTAVRPKVDPKILKEHSLVSPWASLSLIVAIYAAIGLIFYINHQWRLTGFTLFGILVISGLQVHLSILMHEGAHHLLHPDRQINGLLNELCAFPLGNFAKIYQAFHLQHHCYSGAMNHDPEVAMYHQTGFDYGPLTPIRLILLFLKDLTGVLLLQLMGILKETFSRLVAEGKAKKLTLWNMVEFALYWAMITVIITQFGLWTDFLILWLLPAVTMSFFLLRVHGYGEHTSIKGKTEFERTFVHQFHPVTNFFFYPIKSGHHLEHHLYSTVPWYLMGRFSCHLLQSPEYRSRSEAVTLDGVFFGKKTILNQMLLEKERRDFGGEEGSLIEPDTKHEIDHQIERSL